MQHIDLIARMVTANQCNWDDKELAMVWIAEMTTQLIVKLDEYVPKSARVVPVISGGRVRGRHKRLGYVCVSGVRFQTAVVEHVVDFQNQLKLTNVLISIAVIRSSRMKPLFARS